MSEVASDAGIAHILTFASIGVVAFISLGVAFIVRNPAILYAALAWIAAAASLITINDDIGLLPGQLTAAGQPIATSAHIAQAMVMLFVGSQYQFVSTCLLGGVVARRELRVVAFNARLAVAAGMLALVVLQPDVFGLYALISLAVLAAMVVMVLPQVGRSGWGVLASLLLSEVWIGTAFFGEFRLSVTGGLVTDLVALVMVAAGSLGTAFAILVQVHEAAPIKSPSVEELQETLGRERADLRKAFKESFLANESKYRFLASISHDLRQPMYAINLYVSILLRQIELLRSGQRTEEHLQQVVERLNDLEGSAQHLNVMFEALLDFSRLASGNVVARLEYVSIERLLGQLESDYAQQALEQGLTLKLRVPARLSRILVQTDLVFLERVLRNLIVNALRYTANGGIALSLVTRKDYIEFRVVDTGPGIEPALRERIFEEFFQVPGSQISAQRSNPIGREARPAGVRPANRESRIGLGLTISARLAEGLGTQIRVKSRVGKGSVFYFRQPFRTVIRSVEQAMPDPLAEKFTSASLPKGLFVAVIDDDPDVRKSTSELLMTFLEADVYSYDNAEDALAQLGREGRVPGFIISDYGLPGRDGLYAIEALRDEFNAEIPALLITGDNTVASIERFKTARLNHLIKPVTGPVLIAAIGTAMSDAATATF